MTILKVALIVMISAMGIFVSANRDVIKEKRTEWIALAQETLDQPYQGFVNTMATMDLFAPIDFVRNIEWPELPEITLPEISLPDINWPEMPEIEFPEFQFPEIKLPEIKGPDLSWITEVPVNIWSSITQTGTNIKISLQNFAAYVHDGVMGTFNAVGNAFSATQASLNAGIEGVLNALEPAAGNSSETELVTNFETATIKQTEEEEEAEEDFRYAIEDSNLSVEGVLVPKKSTVISSSRDGQIKAVYFDNGEVFRKGDVLIEYDCRDLLAELSAAEAEKTLTEKRSMRNEKLFKLDIISDIDHLGFKAEDVRASAQKEIVEARLESCKIRANYDGRVTNLLANAHEFTRTDRVLMEVASLDNLDVEFLLPSRWLRWINIGAPVTITVSESDTTYQAIITRIHGEVDPVSQSIQVAAQLEPYETPLLPGMSGRIEVDLNEVRSAGIYGFLEKPPERFQ